ncbi:MAG: hypothetical protein M3Y37_06915, partial [Chloroflexota bacterium]|nr:hypothetical protein [Chloroflexota bacterium]
LLEPDFADDEAIGSWPPAPAVATSGGVWSGIVRTCQSCRDFRPAGNGERGWCNNQWAFKHRRMVDADDRPCETSIGHWWIPSDTAWLGTFDVSALGEPTPLVDKYITGGSERRTAEELPLRRRRQS